MAVTKKEKTDSVRAEVMGMFADTLMGEDSLFTQTDSGAFVIAREFVEGDKSEELFVEVKFIVKGETFDIEDAIMAFDDKRRKASERESLKAQKAAERLAKSAERQAKEKAKEEKAKEKEKAKE